MEAELFRAKVRSEGRADRQTDKSKLIVAFRKFVKEPKAGSHPKGDCWAAVPSLYPKFKRTHRFCWHNDINNFIWLTLRPKWENKMKKKNVESVI